MNQPKKIPSILLDIMRLSAALIVLFVHSKAMWFPNQQHDPKTPHDISHTAVVLFFVLSGFVIAFTTINKNRGFLQYMEARLGRLYSIVLPGLLITALCEYLVAKFDPLLYTTIFKDHVWLRYLISGMFLNEIWFFSSVIPMNGPLWSLGYEFWYYIIFGCWFFKDKGIKSWFLLIIVIGIAGPKIMIMMPVWIAGFLAYKVPKPIFKLELSLLLLFGITVLIILTFGFCPPYPFIIGSHPFFWAGQFVTDYLMGILFALFFWLLPVKNYISLTVNTEIINFFRKVADLTFPIYVFHWPLLILYKSVFNFREANFNQWLSAMTLVLLVSSFLGFWLNKFRPIWDKIFGYLLLKLKTIHPFFGNWNSRKFLSS